MKFLKKLTALLTAFVMTVAGFSVCSAADSEIDYMYLNIGDTITYTFPDYSRVNLMFDAEYSGDLTIGYKYTSVCFCGILSTATSDGKAKIIRPDSIKSTKGDGMILETEVGSGFLITNEEDGLCECEIKYKVVPGTYLIMLSNESKYEYKNRGGNITVSLSLKRNNASLKSIYATLNKGDTLQLGVLLSDGTEGKVKWSSSKKSVATVNSKGKITAKSKGKTVITASDGNQKIRITVVVS